MRDCRGLGKVSMVHNSYTPRLDVNPETYEVKADGQVLTCEPAIYIPEEQTGIRLENNILISADGPVDLRKQSRFEGARYQAQGFQGGTEVGGS